MEAPSRPQKMFSKGMTPVLLLVAVPPEDLCADRLRYPLESDTYFIGQLENLTGHGKASRICGSCPKMLALKGC